MDISGKTFKTFLERQEALNKQYSPRQAEKQHVKGKLTAQERINLLFDSGTFEEIDAFVTPAAIPIEFGKVEKSYGDGVIVGHGKVNGRLVFAYAQISYHGRIAGACSRAKIIENPAHGTQNGCAMYWYDGLGGARIQEGVASLHGYAAIFKNIVQSSGVIPQISVIMGPAPEGRYIRLPLPILFLW